MFEKDDQKRRKGTLYSKSISKGKRKLKSYFEEAINRGVIVYFINRDNKFDREEEEWLQKLGNRIRRIENKNLHAKCYLNHHEAIITSMNFYEYSQDHNYEMGILIFHDEPIFSQVNQSVRTILNHSIQSFQNQNIKGFCIKCHKDIRKDNFKPLCYNCYIIWAEYNNPEYTENYCHNCGKEGPSSMNKPLCYDCYNNNHQVIW